MMSDATKNLETRFFQSEAMLVEHKLMASRTVAVRGADPIIIEAIPLNTVADCHARAVSHASQQADVRKSNLND
ncbi:hypothetical protein AB3X96_37400 [Paraburkholderia sp. BR13439]|uniref:Uncharacterized protein n=1 Tax=Paraburkholderia youngii TaxID=2782701 RepID=A0A7Y6K944_9BURK|nr:hypothetical protein [Paraburkholderia youngii]NUY05648.1 hypothetical protein [Paraburkholderia youngii]NVI09464.1 hypothetical protein [Paraburkholderia youngii]